jgi:hypothetical protein
VAPHWPRDVHPLVKGQCAPGRLPTEQIYRVYLRFRDRPRRVPSSLFDGQSAFLRLRGSLGGAPGGSRTRTEGGAGRRSRPLRASQVARKMDPLLLSKSSRSLRASTGGFGRVYAVTSDGEEAVAKLVPKDRGVPLQGAGREADA